MARGNQAVRLLRILSHLNRNTVAGRGTTIAELARTFGVVRRTLYRDLENLQEAGFPLVGRDDGSWRGGIRLVNPVHLPDRNLDLAEVVALHASGQLVRQCGGVEHAAVGDLIDSLERSLGGALRGQLAQVAARLTVSGLAPRKSLGDQTVPVIVSRAFSERRVMRLKYYSAHRDATEWRTVHPYEYICRPTASYVNGFCEASKALRTFALNRIVAAELTDRSFEVPAEYLGHGEAPTFGVFDGPPLRVRLRFAADKAFYATERRWHPSQRERRLPDGRVELSFTVAGLPELAGFVLHWGGAAEVVEPPELRALVRSLAEACARVNGAQTKRGK